MQKGVGIAALVVAIIAIFVPGYGLHLSAVAIVLAVIAALAGDRIFATATPIIAGISVYFLSPLLWLMLADVSRRGGSTAGFHLLAIAFFVAPFVAMYLNSKGIITLGAKTKS